MTPESLQKRFRQYIPKEEKEDLIDKQAVQIISKKEKKQYNLNPRQYQPEEYQQNNLPFQAQVVVQDSRQYPPEIPGLVAQEVGLTNIGSTCYMNSILQCLMRMTYLIESIKRHSRQSQFSVQFIKIQQYLEQRAIVPREELVKLKSYIETTNPQFQGSEQQDSSEFLTTLINMLHEQLVINSMIINKIEFTQPNDIDYRIMEYLSQIHNSSPIQELLNIHYLVCITCKLCKRRKFHFEDSFQIDLILSPNQDSLKQMLNPRNDLLKSACIQCGKSTEQFKDQRIIKLPKYLLVNLRRYKKLNFMERLVKNKSYEKNIQRIKIDSTLDLRGNLYHVNQQTKYYLKSFVDHKGTEQSGHYTSYSFDNQWHFYNDLKVQLCPLQVVINILDNNTSGYNLIYQQY